LLRRRAKGLSARICGILSLLREGVFKSGEVKNEKRFSRKEEKRLWKVEEM
jgi:hypothetical protein